MKPPTNRQLSQWWQEQPEGEYTCSYCGKVGPKAYVQPQHPFYGGGARCTDCHNKAYHDRKAARKAELAAMPRCEFCGRRGSWRVGAGKPVLLCGAHKHQAQAEYQKRIGGLFWLAWEATGDDIREMLTEINRPLLAGK